MAGVFRKAMVWLGLAPDEEYDDYGYDEHPLRPGPSRAPGGPVGYGPAGPSQTGAPGPGGYASGRGPQPGARGPQGGRGPVEPDEAVALQSRPTPRPSGAIRPMPARAPDDPRPERADRGPTVRPMRPTSAKPTVVTPESFDDAKHVADRFKADQPVVMDLSRGERDLARRLIDFSSGICYALGGHMERVAAGIYLLTPPGVEVSAEERRRLAGGR